MISAKKIVLVLIFITSVSSIDGQNWHEFRPNTFQDSLAVIKNGVALISSTISISKNVFDSENIINSIDTNFNKNDSVWIFQNSHTIDSSKVSRLQCNDKSTYKLRDDKIIETKTFFRNSDNTIRCICERVHYFNKDKQIYLTTNKLLKGRFYEEEGYSSIRYSYQNGLLTEAQVYHKNRRKEYLYWTQKFKYDFDID